MSFAKILAATVAPIQVVEASGRGGAGAGVVGGREHWGVAREPLSGNGGL
jgi:hypothetical protein